MAGAAVEKGTLVYWLKLNQVLRIGNGDVTITVKETAPGRVKLRMEIDKNLLPISTETPLALSNQDRLDAR